MSDLKTKWIQIHNEVELLREGNAKLTEALAHIKWSIKSCRAGDGDTRTWEQCCLDCETVAEEALNDILHI
jgi:hypothetical protein